MYKDDEWSGLLFFKVVKGDLDNIAEMEFQTVDFVLQDIGTKAHTQFDNEDDLVDLFIENEDLARSRMGLMHSHNTMATFFSGEDMDEIEDNSVGCDFYLSLIVNNKFEPKCKIAFRGRYKSESWIQRSMKTIAGTEVMVPRQNNQEGEALYTADVDVFVPDLETLDRDLSRFHARKEAEKQARISSYQSVGKYDSKPRKEESEGGYNRPPYFVSPRQQRIDFDSKESDVSQVEFESFLSKLISLDLLFEGSVTEACKKVAEKVSEPGDIEMYVAYVMDNIESYYEQCLPSAETIVTYTDSINLEKRMVAHLKNCFEGNEPIRKLYFELSKDIKDNEELAREKDEDDDFRAGFPPSWGGQRNFVD